MNRLFGERLGVLTIYFVLLILNYYSFKKLQKLNPEKWQSHEANLFIRLLTKKIGLQNTFILLGEFAVLLFLFLPWSSFLLGFAFGTFFFVLVHDFHTFHALIKKKEVIMFE